MGGSLPLSAPGSWEDPGVREGDDADDPLGASCTRWDGIMTARNYYWRTIAFAPEPHRLELRQLEADDGQPPQTAQVVGWLTQEQVYDDGERVGVAAVRVIAGILRPFSDAAAAVGQEEDEGFLATEVIAADDVGWHAYWSGTHSA